jgi:protease-4
MRQFLITIAGVFLGLALFFIGVPLALVAYVSAASRPAPVAGRNVLLLDLRGGLTDQEPHDPFSLFTGKTVSVIEIEKTLRRAAGDDHVGGILVRLPEGGIAPAAADELRAAFLRFRAAKKPILAFSQGFYASGTAPSTYELAAASGDIWMQPSSQFQVTGMSRDDLFFKRFFDLHAIKPDFQQRNQYKTAINGYLYSDYTAAHRESELSWMGSVYDTALGLAGADRGRPAVAVRTTIEAGPYSAEDAAAKGLIDHVGSLHAAGVEIRRLAGDDAKLTRFADYAKSDADAGDGPTVAVISLEGAIMTGAGGGGPNPLGGESTVQSDDVTRAFREAIDDDAVKAIVFRVSSPGGSDTASEQILESVREARTAGKPVVVSMGEYGASGGYWISSQANEILAEPTTLTGSIGVFGGKFALGDALAKFGVDMRSLKVGGDYTDSQNPASPMTATQRAAFSAEIDRIYAAFIQRVSQGRRIPEARVREIANGRVWTGAQAKTLGLVDSLGGFYDAVERAKALGGIKGGAKLVDFGGQGSPLQSLRRMVGASITSARVVSSGADLMASPMASNISNRLVEARLRGMGATVLAPAPW